MTGIGAGPGAAAGVRAGTGASAGAPAGTGAFAGAAVAAEVPAGVGSSAGAGSSVEAGSSAGAEVRAGSSTGAGAGAGVAVDAPAAREDQLFAALANSTRREVLRLLREQGPQPVQALADHFAMRRPSLSEHLKVLREAGLVSEERAGRQRIYRLEAAPLADVQDWLHPYERFWRDRLKGLGDLLDRMPDDAET
jgi:DNA-binding transcriptional ArsR family regulator